MDKKYLLDTIACFVTDFLRRECNYQSDLDWILGQLSFCRATGILNEKDWNMYFRLVNDSDNVVFKKQ